VDFNEPPIVSQSFETLLIAGNKEVLLVMLEFRGKPVATSNKDRKPRRPAQFATAQTRKRG
jgi:hypothetical protein